MIDVVALGKAESVFGTDAAAAIAYEVVNERLNQLVEVFRVLRWRDIEVQVSYAGHKQE